MNWMTSKIDPSRCPCRSADASSKRAHEGRAGGSDRAAPRACKPRTFHGRPRRDRRRRRTQEGIGQFNLLAEHRYHARILNDGATSGLSTQHAHDVSNSSWLTGTRDFVANGLQGYSTRLAASVQPEPRPVPYRCRANPWLLMVGVNSCPTKWVRCRFDDVWTRISSRIRS